MSALYPSLSLGLPTLLQPYLSISSPAHPHTVSMSGESSSLQMGEYASTLPHPMSVRPSPWHETPHQQRVGGEALPPSPIQCFPICLNGVASERAETGAPVWGGSQPPASGEAREPFDYTIYLPSGQSLPKSLSQPLQHTSTQQLAGPALYLPRITSLGSREGRSWERQGASLTLQRSTLYPPAWVSHCHRMRCPNSASCPRPSPSPSFSSLLQPGLPASSLSLSLPPSLTSCSPGSALPLVIPEGS